MAKRSRRRPMRFEKNQAGCMWGLIGIFDFRHGRSTRRLLSDREWGSSHADVSKGSGYSVAELNFLTYPDERPQNIKGCEESEMATAVVVKTSVKELMEEEMVSENGLKKNMNSADLQLSSENSGHVRGSSKQEKKHRAKSCDMQAIDLDLEENSSHRIFNKKIMTNYDLDTILELRRLDKRSTDCLKHGWHDDVNTQSNQVHSLVEEKLGTAIKAFINERFTNDKHLGEEWRTHHSREFMNALQKLCSNEEFFFELLQDPNSLLVKHIQSLEEARFNKDQNTKQLEGSKSLEEVPNKPRTAELITRKHHKFFRRRSKSQDFSPGKGNETFQSSSRIVILKPEPMNLQKSGIENCITASVQSCNNKGHNPRSDRSVSQFSFNEIKRKLKHALGKERHGISRGGVSHRFPSDSQNLKTREKGVGEQSGGWSSPNRNHFYTERFAKISAGLKGEDKIRQSKNSETTVVNETIGNSKHGVSNIYIEAKKHLSEMLSNGDEKEELTSSQLPKTLGRILSLPEYSFTPCGSPGMDREHSFVTAQMRLSPRSNFQMINENTWRRIPDNHAIQLSSIKQKLQIQSCITYDQTEEKVQSPKSIPDVSYELDRNNLVQETASSTSGEKSSEEVLDSATTNFEFLEDIKVLDVSCESSSSLFSRENQNCDAAEVCDKESSSKWLKFGKDSINEDESSSPPPVSPPSSSVTRKIEDSDASIDRAARPSPVSVLEPMFSEDDISPLSTKSKPVATTIQPLQIHFEERTSSDVDQAICIRTCMDNEESAFEYVEAVLLGSGLNWDEFILRWLSSDQLLDPSLFDEVELFSSRSSHDQKLLFDCANEVLKGVCDCHFGCSFVKQNVRPVPKGMSLINEVWKGIEWHLIHHLLPHSLDQLVRIDMSKPGTWMDLRFETDHIVSGLENSILEEMVNDTILGFC